MIDSIAEAGTKENRLKATTILKMNENMIYYSFLLLNYL
jgi:hypothetical protein